MGPSPRCYPADVLEAIADACYAAAQPTQDTLDPLYYFYKSNVDGKSEDLTLPPPTNFPSAHPAPYWPEATARKTLAALCLVSKDFRDAARPLLWRRLEVNQPRNWLGILDAICGEDPEQPPASTSTNSATAIAPTPETVLSTSFPTNAIEDGGRGSRSRAKVALDILPPFLEEYEPSSSAAASIDETLASSSSYSSSSRNAASTSMSATSDSSNSDSAPNQDMTKLTLETDSTSATLLQLENIGTVPHDLLTPPSSRDPSPQRLRLRAASPGRWRFIKAVNQIVHREEPSLYIPTPDDPSPGRHVRHFDFNHFRTIGLRRSVGDGFNARFVTAKRLERLLKEMPNLAAFGATEFMDSAVSKGVLEELLLRGVQPSSPVRRGRPPSPVSDDDSQGKERDEDEEDDDEERRAAAKPLVALDLCGCVSTVFVSAMQAFVKEHLSPLPSSASTSPISPLTSSISSLSSSSSSEQSEVAETPARSLTFSTLERLGLRGVASLPSSLLSSFVLSFENLTHLDLSGTLVNDALLYSLGEKGRVSRKRGERTGGMRLKSLALGRCPRLSGKAIVDFILGRGLPKEDDDNDDEEEQGGDRVRFPPAPLASSRFLTRPPLASRGPFSSASVSAPTNARTPLSLDTSCVAEVAEEVEGGICDDLEDLSLYCDLHSPSPLSTENLLELVRDAPCFKNGKLRYLDLSGCAGLNQSVLDEMFSAGAEAQNAGMKLRSLGLSHIPALPLNPLLKLLSERTKNVEVLTLVGSTPELTTALGLPGAPTYSASTAGSVYGGGSGRYGGGGGVAMQIVMTVHSRIIGSLCAPPFRIAGLHSSSSSSPSSSAHPKLGRANDTPTRLRVLELSSAVLSSLSTLPPSTSTNGTWTTVRSRGGRAWYVDASSGWVDGEYRRGLDGRSALWREVMRLGNVEGGQSPVSPMSSMSPTSPMSGSAFNFGSSAGASATSSGGGEDDVRSGTSGSVGWHAHKMEILHGTGLLGREDGLYGAVSFAYSSG